MQKQGIKLLFFLAVWQRPEITEICFLGLQRLKKTGKFQMETLAVISEPSMIHLCEKYGIDYCFYGNQPLGAKKNFGLEWAKEKDFDYLIEIGSDDILKNEFLDLYPFDKNVMGLCDFTMVNTENGDCRRLSNRDAMFGAGRAISRNALEVCNWKLWPDKLRQGMDNSSEFLLASKGFKTYRYSSPEPLVIDLKSEINIWPFNYQMGSEYPLEKALAGLSEGEINAIQCYSLQKASANMIEG